MTAAALSPAVPKPPHVPDSVVYDFDLRNDPALVANPHDRALDLALHAPPVFWTPRNGGHWVLLSHAANFKAARDAEHFSNSFMTPEAKAWLDARPKDAPHIPMAVPIGLDPPEHTKYRMPLQSAFSPKTMDALKGDIRALCVSLIEKIKPLGQGEFMHAVAEPMPVLVFMKMLGLPLERMEEYRKLVEEFLLHTTEADLMKAVDVQMRTVAAMRDVFIERRDHPKDDLISLLWQLKIDGAPTTMDDIENYGILLFVAGLDTVMQGIGFTTYYLAKDLELQRRLRANPSLIAEAVEEILRRHTFTVPPRRVAKDIVFEGVPMKENERVMLFLPAADLDPKEFPDPGKVDIGREQKVHIAFNAGPHRCLGSHLARIELNILCEELLSRLPEFRLDPAKPPTFHGGNVLGVDSLNLVWNI